MARTRSRLVSRSTDTTWADGRASRRSPSACRAALRQPTSAPSPDESMNATSDRSTTRRVRPAARASATIERKPGALTMSSRPAARISDTSPVSSSTSNGIDRLLLLVGIGFEAAIADGLEEHAQDDEVEHRPPDVHDRPHRIRPVEDQVHHADHGRDDEEAHDDQLRADEMPLRPG